MRCVLGGSFGSGGYYVAGGINIPCTTPQQCETLRAALSSSVLTLHSTRYTVLEVSFHKRVDVKCKIMVYELHGCNIDLE